MPSNRDVFQDNTVADNQRTGNANSGSPATTSGPGEKPFKEKKSRKGHGYNHVPGAGENPGKLDH